MKPDAVRDLYDRHTAATYNERWHGAPWGNDTDILAAAIARQVRADTRWLDVGCGTGHFLSRHPGVERAGTDMSPSMLAEARAASPDATFFREWDFRNDVPEWRDQWTLVTCTGQPWSYVDTIAEIEQLVANLAHWTAPDGTCLLAMQDVTDLTGLRLPYQVAGEPGFPGEIWMKAVVWSMTDRSHEQPREHDDLVWPTLGHWVATFGRYFDNVVVETQPHDPPWLNTPRRVLLASGKRSAPSSAPPEVVHRTFPEVEVEDGLADAVDEAIADDDVVADSGVAGSGPAAPEDPVNRVSTPARHGPVPLRDLTVGHLMDRARPWDPRLWAAVERRTRAAVTRRRRPRR